MPVEQLPHLMLDTDWTINSYKVSDGYLRDVCNRINPHLYDAITSLASYAPGQQEITATDVAYYGRSPSLALRIVNEAVMQFRHLLSGNSLCIWNVPIQWEGILYPGLVIAFENSHLSYAMRAWHSVLATHCGLLAVASDLKNLYSENEPFYQQFLCDVEQLSEIAPFVGKGNQLEEISTTPMGLTTIAQEEKPEAGIQIPPSRLGRPVMTLYPTWRAETLYRKPRLHVHLYFTALHDGVTYEIGGRCLYRSVLMNNRKLAEIRQKSHRMRLTLERYTATRYQVENALVQLQGVPWKGDRCKVSKIIQFIASYGVSKSCWKPFYSAMGTFIGQLREKLENWPRTAFELWDAVFEFSASTPDVRLRHMLAKACWNFLDQRRWEQVL